VPEQSPGEKVQYKKSEGSWPQTRKVHPMKRPFGQSKSENFQVTCRCTWILGCMDTECVVLSMAKFYSTSGTSKSSFVDGS